MNAQVSTLPVLPPTPAESAFGLAQRQARAMCNSNLVPEAYRGEKNLANVLIAMELAHRIGSSPLLVMQSLYVVQGKPSWSSSFLIATVNACGRFEPIRFEVSGTDPHAKDYRVRAYAKDKASGEVCQGCWITWKMVDGEGWGKKSGSKWLTMPEQMFMYRAAGFWTRTFCPEISLGMLTQEEAQDVWGDGNRQPTAPTDVGSIKTLEAELKGIPADPVTGEVTYAEISIALESAPNRQALDEAADMIRYIPDAALRSELSAIYKQREDELSLV